MRACASCEEALSIDPTPRLVVIGLGPEASTLRPEVVASFLSNGTGILAVTLMGSHELIPALMRAGVTLFVPWTATAQELHREMDHAFAQLAGTPSDMAGGPRSPTRPSLSDQERRALALYASGEKLETVARRLGVKPTTAKEYIERGRAKYVAVGRPTPTKVHLRVVLDQDGLLDPDTP